MRGWTLVDVAGVINGNAQKPQKPGTKSTKVGTKDTKKNRKISWFVSTRIIHHPVVAGLESPDWIGW